MKRDVGGIEEAEHDILWQHEYRSSCPSNSKRAMPAFSTCVAKAAEDRTDSSQACGRELMRKTVTSNRVVLPNYVADVIYPVMRTFGPA